MSEHFNRLTPAEDERLALLIEECAEVIQVVGKIQRNGYDSHHPDDDPANIVSNRMLLVRELGDVSAAIDLLVRGKDVRADEIFNAKQSKLQRVAQYLHHQLGILA